MRPRACLYNVDNYFLGGGAFDAVVGSNVFLSLDCDDVLDGEGLRPEIDK